jgi:hemerythrin-like metal-binding protein
MTALAIETEHIKFEITGEVVGKMRRFWREHDFTMGIDLLDAQHMWLIALVFHIENLLKAAVRDDPQIEGVLSECVNYAQTHFRAEEALLHAAGYPIEQAHVMQHRNFTANIQNLIANTEGNAVNLGKFLQNWLVQHIKKDDIAYRDFLKQSDFDANAYFQSIVASSSEFNLTPQQLELHAAIVQNNEIVPGVSDVVLAEIRRLWRSFSIRLYVPMIDMQHLWLIKMVVELEVSLKEEYEKRTHLLTEMLPEVKRYVHEHFSAEECMMEKLGYDLRVAHKKQHAAFVKTIESHNADYIAGTRSAATLLVRDLKDWLLSHILIEDAKFAKLCREKNAEALQVSKQLITEKTVQFKKAQILLYQYVTGQAGASLRRK